MFIYRANGIDKNLRNQKSGSDVSIIHVVNPSQRREDRGQRPANSIRHVIDSDGSRSTVFDMGSTIIVKKHR